MMCRIILSVTLLLAISGCALVGPDYKRPQNEVPALFSEPDVASDNAADS